MSSQAPSTREGDAQAEATDVIPGAAAAAAAPGAAANQSRLPEELWAKVFSFLRAGEVHAVSQEMDVTAHAEVRAIRAACRQLHTIDLSGCVLYSTLEPCPMCFSASEWANIAKIVYGARRGDAEKFGLGDATIPVHAIKELGNSRIELVSDTLREDNLRVLLGVIRLRRVIFNGITQRLPY